MVSDFLDADWFKKYGEGLVNNESRLIDRLLAKPLPAALGDPKACDINTTAPLSRSQT